MLLRKSRQLLTLSRNICLPSLAYQVSISHKKLNTEVFSDLTYSELANPRLTKYLITKPIHMHSRVSQRSLYHKKRVGGIIRSCFSQKKHKVFRRVQKIQKQFRSDLLSKDIFVTVSRKAFRCINKMGSFDNYILCTKPKDLDSKYGEYLRELMLRKINDPSFRVPYIIGTNRKLRLKSFKKKQYLESTSRIVIPKSIKDSMRTFQKRFGTTPQELNNDDYAKYLELEALKRNLGDQLEPTHPLLVELKEKMDQKLMTKEEEEKLHQMSKEAEENFLNDPINSERNKIKFEKAKHELELLNLKYLDMRFKLNLNAEEEQTDSKKAVIKAKPEKKNEQKEEGKDGRDSKEDKEKLKEEKEKLKQEREKQKKKEKMKEAKQKARIGGDKKKGK